MSNEAHEIKVIMDCLKALEKNTIGGLPEKIQGDITTYAFIAAGSSFIPVPGASAAANVANIWAMYARINSDIGITFSKNILKRGSCLFFFVKYCLYLCSYMWLFYETYNH